MNIYISIDGVIRNTLQKITYHYNDAYFNSEIENDTNFEYAISDNIKNDDLASSFKFQSVEELEYFMFIEYPIEIFGHAGLSYSTTFTDLHEIIHNNSQHKFTIIGLNELGKSKPATLFFLSKNGFLGDNIKFIKDSDIEDEWKNVDMWITDNKLILDKCPKDKTTIIFKTDYNKHFTHTKEINKLTQITELCSKSLENNTI